MTACVPKRPCSNCIDPAGCTSNALRRCERLLMEQLDYNLLFRWFVGMEMDERGWGHAVSSKKRERLLNEEIAEAWCGHCGNWA